MLTQLSQAEIAVFGFVLRSEMSDAPLCMKASTIVRRFKSAPGSVPSVFMPCGQEMIHLHAAKADDLIIAFSSKNDTQRLMMTVLGETAAEKRPACILVSHSANHPLKRMADDFVLLPTWQTERYPVYIEPMTSMLAFCSILMTEVSRKTGRQPATLPPFIGTR